MKRFFVLIFIVFSVMSLHAQDIGIKTNLLYLATTTPNIGVEWKMNRHYTAALTTGYNPFRFSQYMDKNGNTVNPKLRHWLTAAEFRYWFCESFLGWNIGINLFGGEYNVTGLKFMKALNDARYKGWGAGAGLTVGYQFPLSVRWSLDFSVGAGYVHTRYTKYDCYACGDKQGRYKKNYLGPTKAAISIVYSLK